MLLGCSTSISLTWLKRASTSLKHFLFFFRTSTSFFFSCTIQCSVLLEMQTKIIRRKWGTRTEKSILLISYCTKDRKFMPHLIFFKRIKLWFRQNRMIISKDVLMKNSQPSLYGSKHLLALQTLSHCDCIIAVSTNHITARCLLSKLLFLIILFCCSCIALLLKAWKNTFLQNLMLLFNPLKLFP